MPSPSRRGARCLTETGPHPALPQRRREIALFLDRDGVINRQRPDHVKSWAEFEFLPAALEGLALLRGMGTRVVVITNQAAVGRGLLREEELLAIHQRMSAAVRAAGGHIERAYACLHTPDAGCRCRKPATGLLERASAELGIILSGSIMAGDSLRDLDAGRAVGCVPILVGDGDGLAQPAGVLRARDLVEVAALLERSKVGVAAC
jgi:D-glycero-D-manno-heptose 1,7-bisphosphate phosphatase